MSAEQNAKNAGSRVDGTLIEIESRPRLNFLVAVANIYRN